MKPTFFWVAALFCQNVNQLSEKSIDSTIRSSCWGTWGGLLLGAAIVAPVTVMSSANAAELTQWSFDPETRQLEVRVPGGTTPNYFLLAQPARIVLDLPNTRVGNVLEEQRYSGMVRHIRVGQFQPGLTRIVIELSSEAVLAPAQVELRNVGSTGNGRSERWVLRPLLAGDAPVVAIEPVPPTPVPEGVNDPVEVEPEGVVFEPSPHATGVSEEAIARPVALDESESEDVDDSAEAIEASEASSIETSELPPLEPGAFEIPVVIPPPEGDRSDRSSPSEAGTISDSERDELVAAETQLTREDSEINLPVAIAPPEAVEEGIDAAGIDLDSLNPDTSNVDPETSLDIDTQTIGSAPSDDADAVAANLTNRSTQRIQVTSPEELQQALDEIISGNTDAQVIRREPALETEDEPESDEIAPDTETESDTISASELPDEGLVEPSDNSSSTPINSDSAESVPLDDSEAMSEPISAVPESPNIETRPSSDEAAFPSPENNVSSGTAPSLESEIFQDLPPASLDIDESVSVNVPALDAAEASESSAAVSAERFIDERSIEANSETRDDDIEDEVSQRTTLPDLPPSSTPSDSVADVSIRPTSATANTSPNRQASAPIEPIPELSRELSIQSPVQSDRQLIVAARSGVQIPSGTVLTLRYPRLTSTLLQTGIAWQDVLLLEQTIRDSTGQVIAPEGSQIIGRFEITDRQVRFVTQAIAIDGRNIPLQAVSGWVAIADNTEAVLIRPNQIVNVRLAENFSR